MSGPNRQAVSEIDELRAENEALRARVRALEEAAASLSASAEAERSAMKSAIEEKVALLEATLHAINDTVYVIDHEGRIPLYNDAAKRFITPEEAAMTMRERLANDRFFWSDGETPMTLEETPGARALAGEKISEEVLVRWAGDPDGVWLHMSASPVRDRGGAIVGAVSVVRDVSDQRRREREARAQIERERAQNEVLSGLKRDLLELSAPVLEVWDDVLVLPVIGAVDDTRSADMTRRLLDVITAKQARSVIVDITGVDVIDTMTADRFLRMIRAVELVGARCLLTGVRAQVAQTLVSLGASMGRLDTLRTLKHGLKACLAARGG